jgi:hypothetical protein
MNLQESFVQFLAGAVGGTFGTDIFIGEAPSSDQAPDALWWVTAFGGSNLTKLPTGERIESHQVEVRYRNRSGKAVYDALYDLEDGINTTLDLVGFDIYDVSTLSFPVDEDLDSEERRVGLLQVTITIYKANHGVS